MRVVNLGNSIIVKMTASMESWKIISIANFYFGSEDNLVSLENKTWGFFFARQIWPPSLLHILQLKYRASQVPFLLVKDDASLGYTSQAACALQRHSKICRVSHVVLKCSQYVCRLELTKKLQSLKNDTYLLIFHYKRLFIRYTGEYKKLKKFSYAHNFSLLVIHNYIRV